MICKSYNDFFMNFANKTKLDIMLVLKQKPMTVNEITKKINGEQSQVSHNLKKLANCHILNVEQKGRERIYSLNKETVIPILQLVARHVATNCKGKCCQKPEKKDK